jgi:DNA-binding GntR family transcriptional regulator
MRIEKTVDRGSKEKLYVQIYSIFLGKIESGEWPAGNQIPTEDELCRIYDVSKVTVREAIQELVREGYLKRLQGKGTFVTFSMPHMGIGMRTRLTENLFGEEVRVSKEIIEKGIRGVSDDIRKVLMTDTDIYYILTRKTIDDESCKEEFYIPSFILPDLETEDISEKSIYDLIEEKGSKKIFRVIQTMEGTKVKEDTAKILNVKEGSHALLIGRIVIGSDGSPIAFSRITGGGKKHKFQMEFERIK